jgi:hypothetical protein
VARLLGTSRLASSRMSCLSIADPRQSGIDAAAADRPDPEASARATGQPEFADGIGAIMGYILAARLANLLGTGCAITQIIGDLEGIAERFAKTVPVLRIRARCDGASRGRTDEQGGGFGAVVDLEVDARLAFPSLTGDDAMRHSDSAANHSDQRRDSIRRGQAFTRNGFQRQEQSTRLPSAPQWFRRRLSDTLGLPRRVAASSKHGRSSWTSEAQCRSSIAVAAALDALGASSPSASATARHKRLAGCARHRGKPHI